MDGKSMLRSTKSYLACAVAAGLGLGVLQTAGAEADASSSPAEQYRQLVQQYDGARQEFIKAYQSAKTDAERQKLAPTYPQAQTYAPRFLKLARENPQAPVAVDALVWVVVNARYGTGAETALSVLRRDHLNSDKLGAVCESLVYSPWTEREEYLRVLSAKNPHRAVQGQARYALALVVKDRDPAQSEKLLDEVAAKFGDVKSDRGATLGDAAKTELYEVRMLGVGKEAPEIEGQDTEGKTLKLSDYRGKVVMLDFWGDW